MVVSSGPWTDVEVAGYIVESGSRIFFDRDCIDYESAVMKSEALYKLGIDKVVKAYIKVGKIHITFELSEIRSLCECKVL